MNKSKPASTTGNGFNYADRHLGNTETEITSMLARLGLSSVDDLITATIPEQLPKCPELEIPAFSEADAWLKLQQLADSNSAHRSFIGQGFSKAIMPAPIRRHLLNHAGWYTAYTPYQPEISQGRLEMLLNFQQLVGDLTGLDFANASLLDEASALAEAMAMALRSNRQAPLRLLLDQDCYQAIKTVIHTRAQPLGIEVVPFALDDIEWQHQQGFAAIFAYPGISGQIQDVKPAIARASEQGMVTIVASNLLSMVVLEAPGLLGADIVAGSTQSMGVAMGYGGPAAGFIACAESNIRALPGRMVGVSKDRNGKPALRLTLQTREQHIRRDRATSNICTAQSLPAILTAAYSIYHGYSGLVAINQQIFALSNRFAELIQALGLELVYHNFLATVTFRNPSSDLTGFDWYQHLLQRGFEIHCTTNDSGSTLFQLTFDEACNANDWHDLVMALLSAEPVSKRLAPAEIKQFCALPLGSDYPLASSKPGNNKISTLSSARLRQQPVLQHPIFQQYRTETRLMRYLRSLVDRDLALDRTMIPLGSCTMKSNPATAMDSLSLTKLADIHPYANRNNLSGYRQLLDELATDLASLTGFDQVSLQPNAGSQGEFAGLLAIRRYFAARNQDRSICLVPESAHGTNPASATIAGLRVVAIKCTSSGDIDIDDLKLKLKRHQGQIAALMLTYPSTHGVFESQIDTVIALVKAAGGQIYFDGANLNAMIGLLRPGDLGADVCHINLHKTFSIPHGGGGPGAGPIGVKQHLVPFLPGDPNVPDSGAVCASLFGSASILAISWLYIRMLGFAGMRKASQHAILSTNYLAEQLTAYFPVLYRGAKGRVAHECILDCRELQKRSGITVEDIAKRMIDYGLHAPTMAWPVHGTLMVELTESEAKSDIDYFIATMRAIHAEITNVVNGVWPKDNNPLVNAPHTMTDLLTDPWPFPYGRELAIRPALALSTTANDLFTDVNADQAMQPLNSKAFLAPVARVDQAYGDRNPFCSCIPPATDELNQ